jgi:hypothetical protein
MMRAYDGRIMRRAWLVGGATVALALGACGGDTEILVKVTRDATVTSPIPRLRVYAAVANGQTMNGAQVFVDQADPAADVDVSARDLATAPYTLAIKPGGGLPSGAALQIAALGFKLDSNNEPRAVAFAAIDHTVSFDGGHVLEWQLSLAKLGGTVTLDARGCADFMIGTTKVHVASLDDWDCDGDPHGTDCNDLDPAVNHMATEICGNQIDEDCSGAIDDDTDADHDGFFACKGDCIDNPSAQLPGGLTAADVHPGAAEKLDNTIDENCDGTCEVGPLLDADKDHYTTNGILTTPSMAGRCRKSDALVDCDDMDKSINPGATENPQNGIDDDCDGTCDVDEDGDGYTPSGYVEPPTMAHCAPIPNGQVDCNDMNKDIHPGATEVCDGIDENCDGKCDDDVDGDGYSVCGTVTPDPTKCVIVNGGCGPNQQCDCAPNASIAHPVPPNGQPVPERCDGVDENCDGVLFPQQNQCFVAGSTAGSCFAGTRTCKDDDPTMPWQPCQPDMSQPVDPKLCTAYDACFSNTSVPDPFACAMQTAPLGVIGCRELVSTNNGAACLPAFDALPQLVAAGQCMSASWEIFGGTTQGPWTVGFGDGGQAGAMTTGCTATFSVAAYDHNLMTTPTTRILVTQWIGAQAVSVFVDLQSMASAVCATPDNLACTGP